MAYEKLKVGNCRLINADCREVLRDIPNGYVDAAVFDPPYGIDFEYNEHVDDLPGWQTLMLDVIPEVRRIASFVILPSCAINRLQWWYANLPPDWLVSWHKGSPGHVAKVGFNDWEPHICYGRPKHPMHDHFSTGCGFDPKLNHPCPKPIEWALWLVERAAPFGGIVIDPFMGSGTTAEACVRLGRRFIGIEKDPLYFEEARQRVVRTINESHFELIGPDGESKIKPPRLL